MPKRKIDSVFFCTKFTYPAEYLKDPDKKKALKSLLDKLIELVEAEAENIPTGLDCEITVEETCETQFIYN